LGKIPNRSAVNVIRFDEASPELLKENCCSRKKF